VDDHTGVVVRQGQIRHLRQFCEEGVLMSAVHDTSIHAVRSDCANTTMLTLEEDVYGAACTPSNSRLECGMAADAVPHMVYYESSNCTGAKYDFPVDQCKPQVRLYPSLPQSGSPFAVQMNEFNFHEPRHSPYEPHATPTRRLSISIQ